MNSKKILIIILSIIIVLGVATLVYWQWQKWQKQKQEPAPTPEEAELKMLNLDLIDSPLKKVSVPDLDLNAIDNLFDQFNIHLPDLSLDKAIDVKSPKVEINF